MYICDANKFVYTKPAKCNFSLNKWWLFVNESPRTQPNVFTLNWIYWFHFFRTKDLVDDGGYMEIRAIVCSTVHKLCTQCVLCCGMGLSNYSFTEILEGYFIDAGPCLTTVTWRYRKTFGEWERSFHWKLSSHWLKGLRHRHIAVVTQGPWHTGTRQLMQPLTCISAWISNQIQYTIT